MALTSVCFSQGADYTSVKITFYKIAAATCLVTASNLPTVAVGSIEYYGAVENLKWKYTEKSENLSPWGVVQSNPVPFEYGVTVSLDFLLAKLPYQSSTRLAIMAQRAAVGFAEFGFIVKFEFMNAVGTTSTKLVMYGRITEYDEDITKPKASASMTIESIPLMDSTTGEQNFGAGTVDGGGVAATGGLSVIDTTV